MAVLSGTYDPDEGPLLNLTIAAPGKSNGTVFPMLLDTGADDTSVSTFVINHLSLRHHGDRPIVTSTGQPDSRRAFMADLSFEFDDGSMWRKFDYEVTEFLWVNTRIRGIIGRDLLRLFNFTVRSDHRYIIEL